MGIDRGTPTYQRPPPRCVMRHSGTSGGVGAFLAPFWWHPGVSRAVSQKQLHRPHPKPFVAGCERRESNLLDEATDPANAHSYLGSSKTRPERHQHLSLPLFQDVPPYVSHVWVAALIVSGFLVAKTTT